MTIENQQCPICSKKMAVSERFPGRVCENCASKISDAYGRRLKICGDDKSGKFRIVYRENETDYTQKICYIDGRKCHVGEHRLDGVIVQIV